MSEQIPPSPELARKNRRLLLILLATFIVPFVIGDLAYTHSWYKGGQTNRGRLITPPIAFAGLEAQDAAGKKLDAAFVKSSWWLLYVLPADCDAACHNRLFQMRQVRRALGKEGERVHSLLVLTAPLAAETRTLLATEFPDFVQAQAETVRVNTALQNAAVEAAKAGQLYVMDPMGWIMLAYAPEVDEKASIVKAEDILKDLTKLLKVSRIG